MGCVSRYVESEVGDGVGVRGDVDLMGSMGWFLGMLQQLYYLLRGKLQQSGNSLWR